MANLDSGAASETSRHPEINPSQTDCPKGPRLLGNDSRDVPRLPDSLEAENSSADSLLLRIESRVWFILSCLWRDLLAGFAAYGQCMGGCHVSEEALGKWHEEALDDLLNIDKRS